MTVGFHSPMPPARTGVAAYSAALAEALGAFCDVRVNAPNADRRVYHIGNNELHREIYAEALRAPDVAVLHDAVLNHFFLGALDRDGYIDEFVYNYGEWSRDLARRLWETRARSAQDPRYFAHPMVKRVAERARAVIVHNPAAARIVRSHAPGARIFEVPHLFAPPRLAGAADALRWRAGRGVDPAAFLFGVFGHLRESKRIETVLCAFQSVRRGGHNVALLVAGDFASPDLARAVAPLIDQPGVLRAPYVPETDFWRMADAVDACVNLRYPAAGETSGITIRLMGIGKPVLVSEGEETSRFPDGSVVRVDTGVAERELLAHYVVWLSGSPQTAREIGQRAAAHIAARHSPAEAARHYWEALSAS